MTFPSDYKVVKFPGSTTGVLDTYAGYERQVVVDTETWNLRLFDGTTPGGHTLVNFSDFASLFLNPTVVTPGTKLSVEVATTTGEDPDLIAASQQVRPWAPIVLRNLFEKIANTATAGTWRILDSAMPDALKAAAKPVNDLDDALFDGFYTVDPSSALNLPGAVSTSTTLNLALIVSSQTTDNVMQMLIERNGSSKIWIRARIDGDWEAWVLATGVTSGDLATKVSKSGDTMTGPLDMGAQAVSRILSINGGPLHGINELINGDFDFWQRAISQTISGLGSADRWVFKHNGSTKNVSKQLNVLGDSAHGAKNFLRHTVASVAGAGNYAHFYQTVEDVLKWAGKRITYTFEAKADAVKDIAIEGIQSFGTGGSPSADVTGINPQRVTLGTTWQKYSLVFDFPSITGKILGTNGNDWSSLLIWLDAGLSFNSRTLNLGQQSGTFEFRHFSARIGDARNETDPFVRRLLAAELQACQRFYEKSYDLTTYPGTLTSVNAIGVQSPATSANSARIQASFKVTKRAGPTITIYSPVTGAVNVMHDYGPALDRAATIILNGPNSFHALNTATSTVGLHGIQWVADAEL